MLENFRLRVFREVATGRSFRRAAEALYISQPAVTQQIKALEEEIGQRLLDRSGGQVRVTAAGAALLRAAEQSVTLLQRASEEIAALGGEMRGSLTVAASTTIAQYILPPLLAGFRRRYPGAALALQSANTLAVLELVSNGKAQIGLIEGPAHRTDLLVEPWNADELVLVVPYAHEWAGQRIELPALATAPLLLREQGSGTRAVLEEALQDHGMGAKSLHVVMELGSTEALLACIEAGLGVGFVSRFALRRQRKLRTLSIVRIAEFRVRRTLSLVRQRGPQAGIAEGLTRFLIEYAGLRQRPRLEPMPVGYRDSMV